MKRLLRHWCLSVFVAFYLSSSFPALGLPQKTDFASAEEELAAALAEAKTDEERTVLLAQKKELMTAKLLRALALSAQRLYSQADFPQALALLRFNRSIAEQMGNKMEMAVALMGTGHVHNLQSDYVLALDYYNRALVEFNLLGDRSRIAQVLISIGAVQDDLGNYSLAMEYKQRALAEFESLNEKSMIAMAMNNIGVTYFSQGSYFQASEYYRKALSIYEELKDKGSIAVALNNIGITYSLQDDYISSLQYYEKSLGLRRELGDKVGIASTLSNIGEDYQKQGKYSQALDYYEKSLKLKEEIGRKLGMVTTLNQIGQVHYLSGDSSGALEFAKRAAAIAQQINNREQLWRARNIAGKAYSSLNQPEQARQAFEEAILIIETLRSQVAGREQEKQRFFEDKVEPYQCMVGLLSGQKKAGEALSYAERAKARVLLDVLHSGRVRITKEMTAQELEQEHKLSSELVSLNTQITRENFRQLPNETRLSDLKTRLQKARLDYEAFQTSLYAVHPELKIRRGDIAPLKLEDAGQLVADPKCALLEYTITDNRTYLFVLTKDGNAGQQGLDLKIYELEIKRKDLFDRAENFRRRLASRDLSFRETAKELYNLLLKPAAAQLQGKTNIIIVPDGALWDLPFQALQAENNRYLVENFAISYAPSITVLREMKKLHKKGSRDEEDSATLLALGNPTLGSKVTERVKTVLMDEKLTPLPEAEKQVQGLKQLYGASHSRVYTGNEAREERIKAEAGNYRLLHLATHAILNDASPMYSQVVLSQTGGEGKEDGLLEAWELMQMNLKADLVVLSACETARGRIAAGEGVIGLSWALFVAGCPTTVVSQWKVESASTTELMLEFHRNLKPNLDGKVPGITKAEALRTAALKLMKNSEYKHPFYWAGFVMVGDGF